MCCRFDDLVQQMGDFQRATEQLKRQLRALPPSDESPPPAAPQLEWTNTVDDHSRLENQDVSKARDSAGAVQKQTSALGSQAEASMPGSHAANRGSAKGLDENGDTKESPWRGMRLSESLDALWKESQPAAGKMQTKASVVHDDELSEFSAETQALLRQIHAINI